MRLLRLSVLATFLIASHAFADGSNVKTAIGGGLGGAAGTAIGGIVGGSTGEVVGGAVGGGLGAATTTRGRDQTGAVIGGAIGGGGGAYVGRQATGTSTGAVIGAGLGGAGGATVGKILDDPRNNNKRYYKKGKYKRGHGYNRYD